MINHINGGKLYMQQNPTRNHEATEGERDNKFFKVVFDMFKVVDTLNVLKFLSDNFYLRVSSRFRATTFCETTGSIIA